MIILALRAPWRVGAVSCLVGDEARRSLPRPPGLLGKQLRLPPPSPKTITQTVCRFVDWQPELREVLARN